MIGELCANQGYAAFLQNAGLGVVVYPERCSGLVCGVPLGHGVALSGSDRIPHLQESEAVEILNVQGREFGLPFPAGWWMWWVGIPALLAMSAESFSERLPQNVPGKFYVTEQCLDCDLCRVFSPTVFRRDAEMFVSYIFHQPETEEEIARTIEAMDGCPCWAIRSDGDEFDWSASRGGELPAWLRGEAPKPSCGHCGGREELK